MPGRTSRSGWLRRAVVALCLGASPTICAAAGSRPPACASPDLQQALQRAVGKYGSAPAVPRASIEWLARTFQVHRETILTCMQELHPADRGWLGVPPAATPAATADAPPPAPALRLTGLGPEGYRLFENPRDGSRMVEVPAGSFLRGNSDPPSAGYGTWEVFASARPARTVVLSSFAIDLEEVRVARYARYLEAHPAAPRPQGWAAQLETPDRPVVGVTWYSAREYARWVGGDLPTEAQWEKAARGTDGRIFPWGSPSVVHDPQRSSQANGWWEEFLARKGMTRPAGGVAELDSHVQMEFQTWLINQGEVPPIGHLTWGYVEWDTREHGGIDWTRCPEGAYYKEGVIACPGDPSNGRDRSPYGVLDLAGGVKEWVRDDYADDYYARAPAHDPPGPAEAGERVFRGAAWQGRLDTVMTYARGHVEPSRRSATIGFRVVRALPR